MIFPSALALSVGVPIDFRSRTRMTHWARVGQRKPWYTLSTYHAEMFLLGVSAEIFIFHIFHFHGNKLDLVSVAEGKGLLSESMTAKTNWSHFHETLYILSTYHVRCSFQGFEAFFLFSFFPFPWKQVGLEDPCGLTLMHSRLQGGNN